MSLLLYTLRQVLGVHPVRALPLLAFLSGYMTFGAGSYLGISGFVWACVLYSVARVAANLAVGLDRFPDATVSGDDRAGFLSGVWVMVLLVLGMAGLQLLVDDPLVSQRMFTVVPLIMAAITAGFLIFDPASLPQLGIPWASTRHAITVAVPAEILRQMATAVFNEWLISRGDLTVFVAGHVAWAFLFTALARWLTLLVILMDEAEMPD